LIKIIFLDVIINLPTLSIFYRIFCLESKCESKSYIE